MNMKKMLYALIYYFAVVFCIMYKSVHYYIVISTEQDVVGEIFSGVRLQKGTKLNLMKKYLPSGYGKQSKTKLLN